MTTIAEIYGPVSCYLEAGPMRPGNLANWIGDSSRIIIPDGTSAGLSLVSESEPKVEEELIIEDHSGYAVVKFGFGLGAKAGKGRQLYLNKLTVVEKVDYRSTRQFKLGNNGVVDIKYINNVRARSSVPVYPGTNRNRRPRR